MNAEVGNKRKNKKQKRRKTPTRRRSTPKATTPYRKKSAKGASRTKARVDNELLDKLINAKTQKSEILKNFAFLVISLSIVKGALSELNNYDDLPQGIEKLLEPLGIFVNAPRMPEQYFVYGRPFVDSFGGRARVWTKNNNFTTRGDTPTRMLYDPITNQVVKLSDYALNLMSSRMLVAVKQVHTAVCTMSSMLRPSTIDKHIRNRMYVDDLLYIMNIHTTHTSDPNLRSYLKISADDKNTLNYVKMFEFMESVIRQDMEDRYLPGRGDATGSDTGEANVEVIGPLKLYVLSGILAAREEDIFNPSRDGKLVKVTYFGELHKKILGEKLSRCNDDN